MQRPPERFSADTVEGDAGPAGSPQDSAAAKAQGGGLGARLRRTMPRSRLGRQVLGGALVVGGLLGFLPVLGFWMVPLGLVVLSVDSPRLRRLRRRAASRLGRTRIGAWLRRRLPG